MSICLLVVGQGLAAHEVDDHIRTSARSAPMPGSMWWWRTRLEALERQATARRDDAGRAFQSWWRSVIRANRAGQRVEIASARHVALAASQLRQDRRQRELRLIARAAESEVTTAMAVLSRTAWRASIERRGAPRVGPLLAAVAGMALNLRQHREELLGESSERALALRAAASEVEMLGLAHAAAAAATVPARAAVRSAQLDWLEVEGKRSAVARHVARLDASLGQAEAMALPAPVAAGGMGDHKREIALERRLPRNLLRLAEEAARLSRPTSYRRLGPASDKAPRLFQLSGIPLLPPIAGRLQVTHLSPAGRGVPGFWMVATITQAVSSPVSGRVVFAAPFRGFGQLLIIDRGEGYHVLLSGLTQLDVDRGASVVAGQAVGEIVTVRKRSTRLYVELRHHGVPVDLGSWQAAREGRVRS